MSNHSQLHFSFCLFLFCSHEQSLQPQLEGPGSELFLALLLWNPLPSPNWSALESLLGFPTQGHCSRSPCWSPNTLQSAPTGCWYDTGNDLYENLRLSPLQRGPPWLPTLVSTLLLLLKLPFHVLTITFCKQKVFYSFCPFSLPLEYKPLGVVFLFHEKKEFFLFHNYILSALNTIAHQGIC